MVFLNAKVNDRHPMDSRMTRVASVEQHFLHCSGVLVISVEGKVSLIYHVVDI